MREHAEVAGADRGDRGDLRAEVVVQQLGQQPGDLRRDAGAALQQAVEARRHDRARLVRRQARTHGMRPPAQGAQREGGRSEEHTSELQSLMRISYAVFCLKKKKNEQNHYYSTSALT